MTGLQPDLLIATLFMALVIFVGLLIVMGGN